MSTNITGLDHRTTSTGRRRQRGVSDVQLSGAPTDGTVRHGLNAAIAFVATGARRDVSVHRQLGVDVVRSLVTATVAVDGECDGQQQDQPGRQTAADHPRPTRTLDALRRSRRHLLPGRHVTRGR